MEFGKKNKKDTKRIIDMREFIQGQLDLWDMGKLVWAEGPHLKSGDDYYELVIKYRIDPNQDHLDDGRISVNIGYTRKGGYWNRRCIRLAIAGEGKEIREKARAKIIWASAQRALTSGRDSGGSFAL